MHYIIHGVAKIQTQLSDFHFYFHSVGLKYSVGHEESLRSLKNMSDLVKFSFRKDNPGNRRMDGWMDGWMGKSVESQWCRDTTEGTGAVAQGEMRRRPWHPTPVLLPGKSHGRRSLVGCSPWGR